MTAKDKEQPQYGRDHNQQMTDDWRKDHVVRSIMIPTPKLSIGHGAAYI